MAPARALQRRESKRGERERGRVHAELGIDDAIGGVLHDRVGDVGRLPRTVRDELRRAIAQSSGELVARRPELMDHDFEPIRIQPRDPALEIPPDGSIAEERRHERDAPAPERRARGRDRCDHGTARRRERGRNEVAIGRLQVEVVLALVGQQEIGPAQLPQDLRLGHRRRDRGQLVAQALQSGSERRSRLANRCLRRRDHRQRQRRAEVRTQESGR